MVMALAWVVVVLAAIQLLGYVVDGKLDLYSVMVMVLAIYVIRP